MRELTNEELKFVAGGEDSSCKDDDCEGICALVKGLEQADLIGAYEHVIDFVEYIMERVSPIPNPN